MTTSSSAPADGALLSQEQVDQLLASYGIPRTAAPDGLQPTAQLDPSDPAVIAAMTARARAHKAGQPVSQFITHTADRVGQLFARLVALRGVLADVKPQQNEAKELGDSLRAELRRMDPHSRKVQLYCTGTGQGFEVRCAPKTSVDLGKLKTMYPAAYADCVTESDQWSLHAISD